MSRTWLAALLGAPTLLAALGIVGVESWRALDSEAPLFSAPPTPSLASALEWGELHQAVPLLLERDDPWEPFDVRHPALTGEDVVRVTPLLWAVAAGNADGVRMLVGLGAPLDRPANRRAVCLADALGDGELGALLRELGLPDAACPEVGPGALPLVALLDGV